MESMSVIKVAVGVERAELVSLHQDQDEPFTTIASRFRSKAETCSFTTIIKCKCGKGNVTSYTEEAVKDVMLAGLGDVHNWREVLSIEDILSRSSFEIISWTFSIYFSIVFSIKINQASIKQIKLNFTMWITKVKKIKFH